MTTREAVADIVRRCLEAGQPVEIEGLGIFQASGRGYELIPQTRPDVFIAYVAEDRAPARRLCDALTAAGCSPWFDKDRLLPGQNWPRAIARGIEVADAFVACFSTRSVFKHGQFQSELRYALDCARRRPMAAEEGDDGPFIIPARFEECPVPRRLADQVQYVDLFPDWEKGMRRVVRAVRKAARKRPIVALG